jgi:hypothetical protein
MDSTYAIATWKSGNYPNIKCRAGCFLLTGTTVSLESTVDVWTGTTNYVKGVCSMSSSKAIVTYSDDDANSARSSCLTLSGTSVSAGTSQSFDAGAGTQLTSGVKLTGNDAVFCYDWRSGGIGKAVLITFSGIDVSVATPITFDSNMGTVGNYATMGTVAFNSSTIAVVYRDQGNSDYGTSCIIRLV